MGDQGCNVDNRSSACPSIRIVEPSWEVLTPLDGERILKSIETVGRTCYQSARNTTEDSCYRFVKMLIERGHEAMIEHEIVTVRFSVDRAVQNELVRHRLSSFAVESTRDRLMQQARKWSDRYRVLKKKGLNDSQIFKTFSEPVNMRVFAYNKKGYIDTTMTPDDSIRYYKSILRTAFVAMEPGTGHVKAYVGGPNYRYFKYDNVRQGKRQVGSTIKPFLYTLAMQEGLTPCTKVTNVPVTFLTPGGETWTPRSTDKEEWIGKTVTLKWGLTNSSNNISAFLMKQYGPEAMADMMKRMGIQSHVDEVPSLCVGPADLTLWEMVAAYNTFPSRGVYVTPLFVTRIEDRQSNSSTILQSLTDRKSIQSVCLKTEWRFLSADSERTHNISISLFVFLTTLFAVPQAVQYYLQSFLPLKVILTNY